MIKIAAMEYFKDLPDVMRVQDVAKALRCSKNTSQKRTLRSGSYCRGINSANYIYGNPVPRHRKS